MKQDLVAKLCDTQPETGQPRSRIIWWEMELDGAIFLCRAAVQWEEATEANIN